MYTWFLLLRLVESLLLQHHMEPTHHKLDIRRGHPNLKWHPYSAVEHMHTSIAVRARWYIIRTHFIKCCTPQFTYHTYITTAQGK